MGLRFMVNGLIRWPAWRNFKLNSQIFVIDYMQFKTILDRTIKLFAETASLLRKVRSDAPKHLKLLLMLQK